MEFICNEIVERPFINLLPKRHLLVRCCSWGLLFIKMGGNGVMERIDLSHAVKHFFLFRQELYIGQISQGITNSIIIAICLISIGYTWAIVSITHYIAPVLNLLGATICHIFNSHQLVYKSLVLVTLWHIQICVSLLYDN